MNGYSFIHPFTRSLAQQIVIEEFSCAALGTELGAGDFAENQTDVDPCFSDCLDPACGEMCTLFS